MNKIFTGKNTLILNTDTVKGIIREWFRKNLLMEDFQIVEIAHKNYTDEWSITLESGGDELTTLTIRKGETEIEE